MFKFVISLLAPAVIAVHLQKGTNIDNQENTGKVANEVTGLNTEDIKVLPEKNVAKEPTKKEVEVTLMNAAAERAKSGDSETANGIVLFIFIFC